MQRSMRKKDSFGDSLTSLTVAIATNDAARIERIFKEQRLGPDALNDVRSDGMLPMHHAARLGVEQSMEVLLRHGADVNLQDGKENTPLMAAVEKEEAASVKWLLAHGANVEIPAKDGITPLIAAAEANAVKIVDALIEGGAALETRDAKGRTALMAAAHKGNAVMAGALVGYGASCAAADAEGNTAMHYAVSRADNGTVIEFLTAKGLIDRPNAAGETPLIAAIKRNNVENAEALLTLGANAKPFDKSGMDAAAHAKTIRRAKFREAMGVMLSGEFARRDMRAGTDHQVTVRKPLKLKPGAGIKPTSSG